MISSEVTGMPSTESPLRYPGGKAKLYRIIQPIVKNNTSLGMGIYIEPYAGGSGLALALLFNEDVAEIVLNDYDTSIYYFWESCLFRADELCGLINDTHINMETWYNQRYIYSHTWDHSPLEIAFSSLVMNCCNISGVMSGGPIGGKNQNGKYLLDARFNKDTLIKKIQRIYKYRNRIHIFNNDASIFLMQTINNYDIRNTILNIDPPYVSKGPLLYTNFYDEADHTELSCIISSLSYKWILTYDNCDLVYDLYKRFRNEVIRLNYSIGKEKYGQEVIIFSDGIYLPDKERIIQYSM